MYYLYTDGGCSGNKKGEGIGGYGFIIFDKNEKKIIKKGGGAELFTTNNRMEMTAVINGLSYLKNCPVNTVKIDRSFVSKLFNDKGGTEDATIIRAIIRLAKELNLTVVAEGVETKEQLKFLIDCGSDICQGFYFSKPLPATEFEKLLMNNDFPKRISA